MAGINIKSISALENKGKAKYYTTCFVEKKFSLAFKNWQFWIMYYYTSFNVVFHF